MSNFPSLCLKFEKILFLRFKVASWGLKTMLNFSLVHPDLSKMSKSMTKGGNFFYPNSDPMNIWVLSGLCFHTCNFSGFKTFGTQIFRDPKLFRSQNIFKTQHFLDPNFLRPVGGDIRRGDEAFMYWKKPLIYQ